MLICELLLSGRFNSILSDKERYELTSGFAGNRYNLITSLKAITDLVRLTDQYSYVR